MDWLYVYILCTLLKLALSIYIRATCDMRYYDIATKLRVMRYSHLLFIIVLVVNVLFLQPPRNMLTLCSVFHSLKYSVGNSIIIRWIWPLRWNFVTSWGHKFPLSWSVKYSDHIDSNPGWVLFTNVYSKAENTLWSNTIGVPV